MNFYIRTNFSNKLGIGHIVRTIRLSRRLTWLGHNCFFFLDKKIEKNFDFLSGINLIELYQNNQKFKNETEDAKLFIRCTKKFPKGNVIVDDYRLACKWEKNVKKYHLNLIAFDDLEKKHFADFIISAKINNNLKSSFIRNNFKNNPQLLLGPKYSIIDDKKEYIKKKSKNFQIVFYVGGGGDLLPIAKIINYLQPMIFTLKINLSFIVIIGPLAKNKNKILNLRKKYKNVVPIIGENNIIKYFKSSQIFVGSSGTSIYETAYSRIPSVLFQISKNQQNNPLMLEKIGHYLNLDVLDFKNYFKIAKLIFLLVVNYKRFKKMSDNPEIKIDRKGIDRIIKSLINLSSKKKDYQDYLNVKQSKKIINNKYKIRKVNDKDINHYLLSRNLKINRDISINKKKISSIDHYLWWLNSKRDSFVLIKNDKRILYFFHENVILNGIKYWWGGWFPASKNCQINEILFAQKKQLEITSKISKKTKWISVVKKNNIIALSLIKNLGFKKLKDQLPLTNSIKKIFKTNKNFTYFSS